MMQARDLILDALDGGGSQMTIAGIEEYQRDDPSAPKYNPYIRYAIHGSFTAPQVVKPRRAGHLLNLNDDGDVELNGTKERLYWVRIPYSAVGEDAEPRSEERRVGKGGRRRGAAGAGTPRDAQ